MTDIRFAAEYEDVLKDFDYELEFPDFTLTKKFSLELTPPVPVQKKYPLKFSTLFCSVLEDCIKHLFVILNVNKAKVGNFPPTNMLSSKYREGIDTFYVPGQLDDGNFDFHNLEKLQQLLANFIHIISKIVKETKHSNDCSYIMSLYQGLKYKLETEANILYDNRAMTAYHNKMQVNIVKDKIKALQKTRKLVESIKDLKMKYQDEREYYAAKILYLKRWQDARLEQNYMINKNKENSFNFVITDALNRAEDEYKVHNFISDYLEEQRNDDLMQIEKWMEKYDEDFEQKELEIANLSADLERLLLKTEEQAEALEKRKKDIADYLLYKRNKRLNEILTKIQTRAAIKIQVWWREVMMRKGLGPYRKSKKGKGKKKDNGEKKAKK